MKIINSPERIYLNYGEDPHAEPDEVVSHDDCVEVSWCDTRMFDSDVEYVRADAVKDAHPKCGTCSYKEPHYLDHPTHASMVFICTNDVSPYCTAEGQYPLILKLDEDYCRNHDPEEPTT